MPSSLTEQEEESLGKRRSSRLVNKPITASLMTMLGEGEVRGRGPARTMPEPEHLEIESNRRPLHFSFPSSQGQGFKLGTQSVRAGGPPSYTTYSPPVIISRPS